MSGNGPIIGIDLGTTNSEVAVWIDGKVEIVEVDGNPIMPSYVGIDAGGKLIVGTEARNQYALYPENTVRSIKRKMGTETKTRLGDKEYLPQEISAMILRKLKDAASARLGKPVTRAVITVPAQFSDAQRQATREAGEIAGLTVERILNEPTAACLAYEGATGERPKKIMAFDLGGGTFDVSIVETEKDIVEVISSRGDNHLGGDDMDQAVREWLEKQIYERPQKPSSLTQTATRRLELAAETAKKHLTDFPFAKIVESNLETASGSPEAVDTELSRDVFEEMVRHLVDKTLLSAHQALADAKMNVTDIDEIVLVGGATRVPAIQNALESELRKRPRRDVHPDLAVAYGAGVMAARLMGADKQRVLVDITPYTFGISCLGFVGSTYGPHHFVPIIKAGTPLPTTRSEPFETTVDGQKTVEVKVFEGENVDARENILVGSFEIEGLDEKAPRGSVLLMNMRLDLDGILRVTAIEKATGLSKEIRIERATAKLTDDQLEKSRAAVRELFGDNAMVDLRDMTGPEGDNALDIDGENAEIDEDAFSPKIEVATARVERVQEKMDPADRTDAGHLLERLSSAAANDDQKAFDTAARELDDLLFYLESE